MQRWRHEVTSSSFNTWSLHLSIGVSYRDLGSCIIISCIKLTLGFTAADTAVYHSGWPLASNGRPSAGVAFVPIKQGRVLSGCMNSNNLESHSICLYSGWLDKTLVPIMPTFE